MKKLSLPVVIVIVFVGLAGVALKLGWVVIPGLTREPGTEFRRIEKGGMGPIVKLNPLIINVKDEGGMSYLKTTIVLEVAKKNQVEEVTTRLPFLTDMVILTLGDKRLEELGQPGSKESLKQELLAKMNQSLPSNTIKQLYFDEFLYE